MNQSVKRSILTGVIASVALLSSTTTAFAVNTTTGVTTTAATGIITAKALTSHGCDTTEWHFVITQTSDSQAPATITVTWGNGQIAVVALDKVTGGTAHYATTANLPSTVTSATAVIDTTWTGEFNLSHGPCAVATATPSATPAPTATASPTPTATATPIPTATATPSASPTTAAAAIGTAPSAVLGQQQQPSVVEATAATSAVNLPSSSTNDSQQPLAPIFLGLVALLVGVSILRLAPRR